MDPDASADKMLLRSHRSNIWTQWLSLALGAWLVSSRWTLGTSGAMAWSDLVSGLTVMAFSVRNLWPVATLTRWGNAAAGTWLLFAPLVFWAPDAASLNNDWLVGAFLIGFNVLYPMMPGRAHHQAMMAPGPDLPPGWSYNPSSWLQRGPIIALSLAAFLLARYMAAFQLGHIDTAWDPFFGAGTMTILHSDVSRAWPVSDAGLGAVAYLIEGLMGFMGSQTRWRTMPWMVLAFGIVVIPLGTTSIILVMLQPIAVGTWCTLCLGTAVLMLVMMPLAVDEVAAMLRFMVDARREGRPLWRTFWVGGTLRSQATDERTPAPGRPAWRGVPAMLWGVTVPLSLGLAAALGVFLLFVPEWLGFGGAAADLLWLTATLVAVTAVLAWAEIVRPIRVGLVPLGLFLIAVPFLWPGPSETDMIVIGVTGAIVALLGVPRGAVHETYGRWTGFAKWRVPGRLRGRAARRRA